MHRKKVSLLFLAFVVFATSIVVPMGAGQREDVLALGSKELSISPTNPEFEENEIFVLRATPNGEEAENATGFRQAPTVYHSNYDLLKDHKKGSFAQLGAGPLPARFDLREKNPQKLTPVRDQGPNGSCWTFATYGSMESCLLPGEEWDFSEKNLRNDHGFDWAPDKGGNREISAAVLSRYDGPVKEADDPYDAFDFTVKRGVSRVKDLDRVLYLPDVRSGDDKDSIEAIKRALQENGAVYTTINGDRRYFREKTNAHYDGRRARANHAVTIVGWDDNFSKRNFEITPPGDGAWIIRNSWGPSWGENGYYYVSYWDGCVGKLNAQFFAKDKSNKDIWYHDFYGMTNSVGYYQETAWAANVFGQTDQDIDLDEVGFFIPADGAQYELYLNPDITDPIDGFNERILLAKGEVPYAGYYTVTFKTQRIKKGSYFSPILKITTPGYNQPIPVEQRYNNFCSRATAHSGESYISKDGKTWEDLTSKLVANVCIKAMTRPASGTPQPSEPTEPTQPTVQPTKPTVKPTVKPTQPTEPSPTTTPTKKTDPTDRKPDPTPNPEPTQTVRPTDPSQPSGKVKKITLRAAKTSLQVNEKLQIIADIEPKSAQNTPLKWTLRNNLGMMDRWGCFQAYKEGEEVIIAEASDGSKVQGTLALTITPQVKKELNIAITVDTPVIKAGDQLACRFALTDQEGKGVPWKFYDIRILEANGQTVTQISGFTDSNGQDAFRRTLSVGLEPGIYTVEASLQNDREYKNVKEKASFRIRGENENIEPNIFFTHYMNKSFYSLKQDKAYTFIYLYDAEKKPIRWLPVTLTLKAPNGKIVGTLRKVTDYYGRVYSYIQPNLAPNDPDFTAGTYEIEISATYKDHENTYQVRFDFQ